MNQLFKKGTALTLTLVLLLSLMPLSALAADGEPCTVTTDCTGTYADGLCTVCSQPAPTDDPPTGDDGGEDSPTPPHTHVYDGAPTYAQKDETHHTVTRPCTTCAEQPTETVDEVHTYVDGACACGKAEPPADDEGDDSTPVDEAVEVVKTQLEALPTLEELSAMTHDEKIALHDTAYLTAGNAYNALTEEQKAQVDPAKLMALGAYFADPNNLMTTDEPTTHTITFEANGGSGTMENAVVNGAQYTLPACGFTAPRGMQFKAWKVGESEYQTNAQLTLSGDTTVSAVWELATEHTLEWTGYYNVVNTPIFDIGALLPADAKITSMQVQIGQTHLSGASPTWTKNTSKATLKITTRVGDAPADDSLTATLITSNCGDIKVTVNVHLIAMPADEYIIHVAESENGKISASALTSKAGETITVTVTPASEKYALETLKYNDGVTDTDITESNDVYSFTMPAQNVTITATFKKIVVDTVIVGGVPLEPGRNYANSDGSLIETTGDPYNAKLEGNEETGYTLYINGLDVRGVQNTNHGAGIYFGGKSALTIQMTGNNTVIGAENNDLNRGSYAVYSGGALTITGGKLNVTGGRHTRNGTAGGVYASGMTLRETNINASAGDGKNSYGLHSSQNLNISGSTVTASGSGDNGRGIYAGQDGNITIENSTVTANGSRAGIESYGYSITISGANTNVEATGGQYALYTQNGGVTVNGGTLLAKGGTSAIQKYLNYYAEGLEAFASTSIDGEPTTPYEKNNNNTYKVVKVAPKSTSIPVTGITLNPSELTLFVGQTDNLTATITPDNATNQAVTWSTNNENVATVTQDGTVTAVAPGDATITATAQDDPNKSAICTIHVHGNWGYEAKDQNGDGKNETIAANCKVGSCTGNGGTVTLTASNSTYDGEDHTAVVTVSDDWKGATVSAVSYQFRTTQNESPTNTTEMKNAGFYMASITVGDATASVEYQISPKTLTETDVTLGDSNFTYNGAQQTPTITVKDGGKTLTQNTDYTVSYQQNNQAATPANAGSYDVVITGKGNYTGTVKTSFTIGQLSLEGAAVTLSDNVIFKGGNAPIVTVTLNGNTVAPENYTAAEVSEDGIVVTVVVRGQGNYKDDATAHPTYLVVDLPDPDDVQPDDKSAIDAYEQYAKLSETYNDAELEKALKELLEALTDYEIIKGHKSTYVKGSYKKLTLTANGYHGKFTGIEVDGELLHPTHYSVEKGSTVITLKSAYLESLKSGKHYVRVNYTDGTTDGDDYFRVALNNGSPITGDGSHIHGFALCGLATMLMMCFILALKTRKKGRYER